MRSRSLYGHNSLRPRLPTATTVTSGSSPRSSASQASTKSAWATQKRLPVRVRSASSASRRALRPSIDALDGVVAHLAGADPSDAVERHDPHLAIADLARAGSVGAGGRGALGPAVVGQHLDPHRGHEVHRVLGAAVDLGVAPLAAAAA